MSDVEIGAVFAGKVDSPAPARSCDTPDRMTTSRLGVAARQELRYGYVGSHMRAPAISLYSYAYSGAYDLRPVDRPSQLLGCQLLHAVHEADLVRKEPRRN